MGRRVPESNRTARLCRPLPNRSVNAPSETVFYESCVQAYGELWGPLSAVPVCRSLTDFFGSTVRVCDAPRILLRHSLRAGNGSPALSPGAGSARRSAPTPGCAVNRGHLRITAGVFAPSAAPTPNKETTHPPHHSNPHRSTRPSPCRDVACVARCARLASDGRVAPASVMHPRTGVRRLAPRLDGLARQAVPVCGRDAVHRADLESGRWQRGAVAVGAEGAAVPGLGCRLPGRRLVRMGNRVALRRMNKEAR